MTQTHPSPYQSWAAPAVASPTAHRGTAWAIGLAVAALGTSVLALLVAALGFFAPWLAPGLGEEGFSLTEGTVADLDGLVEGQCFRVVMSRPDTVQGTDCAAPHDGEVYLLSSVAHHFGTEFPGEDELGWAADEECHPAFESYTGQAYSDSEYDYALYAPDSQSWATGDRQVACAIMPYRLGSLEGSARAGS